MKDNTKSGITYIVFILSDGNEIYVDTDGFASINGESAKGEYWLCDGNIIVIDENSQFVETKAPDQFNLMKNKINEMQKTLDSLTVALDDAQKIIDEYKYE